MKKDRWTASPLPGRWYLRSASGGVAGGVHTVRKGRHVRYLAGVAGSDETTAHKTLDDAQADVRRRAGMDR